MSRRKVLLVALDGVAENEVRDAIAERGKEEEIIVQLVAPAVNVGKLQWLAGAEDEGRAEAAELADRTAEAVEAELKTKVQTEVGERDPLLAVEDALALFPADEILVAGSANEKTEAGLRKLGLPISRVGAGGEVGGEEATGTEAVVHDVAEGRAQATPFVVVGIVAAVLLAVIALISLIAFLAFWLA